jgi:ATPase subunit of ABC transporter with duplicated ATPase domains
MEVNMATITFAENAVSHRQARPTRSSAIARLLNRLSAARQGKVDRDIAEILQRRGGVMARTETGMGDLSGGQRPAYPFHGLPALRRR